MLVVRDDGVRRRKDVAHAAIVLLELNHVRLREVALELKDVAQIGSAPGIDRLIVVAHHHDVAVRSSKQHRDLVLSMIGVLVLVNHDVAEALLIGRQHVLVILEQQEGVQKQVVEIKRVRSAQALLQSRVHARGHLAHWIAHLVLEITRHDELVFRLGDAVHERIDRKTLRINVELRHDLFVQSLEIVGVVNSETLREPEQLGIGTQHAHAHAVERRHPHAAR